MFIFFCSPLVLSNYSSESEEERSPSPAPPVPSKGARKKHPSSQPPQKRKEGPPQEKVYEDDPDYVPESPTGEVKADNIIMTGEYARNYLYFSLIVYLLNVHV